MSSTYVDGTTPLDAAHMNALQQKVEKGVSNGYPSLDGTGKVPAAQLPAISSVDYAGAYSAATTYHAGEYVVGADGITYQCVKDGTVGQTPTPWAPAPTISYGTSLPASPVDGMEAVLVDSTTNPSYQWRFRYNAGSSSAYKWEFVGGSTVAARYNTMEAVPVGWTVGNPSFTVARAGEYNVGWSGTVNTNNQPQVYASVYVGGVNVSLVGAFVVFAPVGVEVSYSVPALRVTINAGQLVQCAVYSSLALSGGWKDRQLFVTPVRVS